MLRNVACSTPRPTEEARMRKITKPVALALAVLWLWPGTAPAQEKPIELKFSSWVSSTHGHHVAVLAPWAKMLEEKSGGRLKVTIYPGATLGKPADHFDLVKNGIAEMGFASPGYTPGRFPLIAATELPLLVKTGKGGSQAVWSLYDKYWKADLAGVKILAATPMTTAMLKTLGATPVSIAAPDTYTALERGTVDGTVFPWEAIYGFKLAE